MSHHFYSSSVQEIWVITMKKWSKLPSRMFRMSENQSMNFDMTFDWPTLVHFLYLWYDHKISISVHLYLCKHVKIKTYYIKTRQVQMVGFMQEFKRLKTTETGLLTTEPVHINGPIKPVMNNFIILMLKMGWYWILKQILCNQFNSCIFADDPCLNCWNNSLRIILIKIFSTWLN